MRVTVRSVGPVRAALGAAAVEVTLPEGATVRDLLDELAKQRGPGFAVYALEPKEPTAYAALRVLVNGRDLLPPQYREAALGEADDVLILAPIAGG